MYYSHENIYKYGNGICRLSPHIHMYIHSVSLLIVTPAHANERTGTEGVDQTL